jgi:hypothetical protein
MKHVLLSRLKVTRFDFVVFCAMFMYMLYIISGYVDKIF